MRLPTLPTAQEYCLIKDWHDQQKAVGHSVNLMIDTGHGDDGVRIWLYSYTHACGMHVTRDVLDSVADVEDLHKLFMREAYESAKRSADNYVRQAEKLKEEAAIVG